MLRLRSLVLLVPVLLLVGCEPKAVQFGGKMREKRLKAVVSLSPSTTELVADIAYTAPLVGRTEADNFPASVAKVPVVASVKPDYEMIAALKPDLIVYDTDLYNDADIQKIKALGFDTFAMDAKTVDDYCKKTLELSALLASELNGSSYVDKVVAAKESALADVSTPRPKIAIMMPGQGTEHYIAGSKGFLGDVITSSGGTPVGPDAEKFVSTSPEWLIAQNPDAIVIGVDKADEKGAEQKVNSLLNDARLKSIRAVQLKHIVVMDQDVLLRRGWRVDRLIENIHKATASMSGAK